MELLSTLLTADRCLANSIFGTQTTRLARRVGAPSRVGRNRRGIQEVAPWEIQSKAHPRTLSTVDRCLANSIFGTEATQLARRVGPPSRAGRNRRGIQALAPWEIHSKAHPSTLSTADRCLASSIFGREATRLARRVGAPSRVGRNRRGILCLNLDLVLSRTGECVAWFRQAYGAYVRIAWILEEKHKQHVRQNQLHRPLTRIMV